MLPAYGEARYNLPTEPITAHPLPIDSMLLIPLRREKATLVQVQVLKAREGGSYSMLMDLAAPVEPTLKAISRRSECSCTSSATLLAHGDKT